MNDILYDINILNGLFTEKDFEFLKNSNSYETNIDSRLEAATQKRDKIVEYKSYYNLKQDENPKIDEALNFAENAFKDINEIIVHLYNLKENLKNIEKNILELIIKKENLSYNDSDLNSSISEIKNKINDFEKYSSETDKIIFSNYITVKEFFDKYYNLESEETQNNSNEDNTVEVTCIIHDNSIEEDIQDNNILLISGKQNKVYLPYTKEEVFEYLKTYPNVYKNAKDVIEREFIVGLNFYTRHPVLARFRETYSLIHDREMKSVIDAFKCALDLMFKYELNPAIIAGLKSESQLDLLLECLEKNDLDSFTPFKILFEYNPI